MPSHRNRSQLTVGLRAPVLWVGAALLVLVLAFVTWWSLGPGSEGTASDSKGGVKEAARCEGGDDEPIKVWVPVEAESVVSELAEDVRDCGDFDIRSVASAQAWSELGAEPESVPDVWITDAPVWKQAAADLNLEVQASPVIATSPVVLAAPEAFGDDLLASNDLPDDPSWSQLLALPRVPVTVADPTRDPAALAMLATVEGFVPDAGSRNALLVQLAQNEIKGNALNAAQEAGAFLVPATEQSLSQASSANDFTVVSPKEGSGELSYTTLTFKKAPAGAAALKTALTREDAIDAWREAGFRPGETGQGEAVLDDVPEDVPTPVDIDPENVQALVDTWSAYVTNIQMMVLIDVSRSMENEVAPGRTRVDLTREAAQGALQSLAPRSKLGLRWFATDRGPNGEDWVEAAPMRPLNEMAGETPQAQLLASAVKELDTDLVGGGTGLFDTLADGYRDMVDDYDPEFRSSLVMLTDGKNRDPAGGLSQGQLLMQLGELRDDDRPVEVILLGMGPDVDAKTMKRIAEATGGRYVQVDKAEEMPEVLVGLVAARANG